MTNVIEKKVLPEYFDALLSGKKTYELRLNDFDIAEGDSLHLREWNADTESYTGRELTKEVSYVASFDVNDLFWSKEEIDEHGLQVIALK